MKIFLTGASGYVGSHVAAELLRRGHRVVGLARAPSTRTESLPSVDWIFAELAEFDKVDQAIQASHQVIHCAMNYSDTGEENSGLDGAFAERVLASNRFFIYTGNLYSPRPDPHATFREQTTSQASNWRLQREHTIVQASTEAAVIRLGFVYGGSGGYLWLMLPPQAIAATDPETIKPAYWPMIHVLDVASLYATVAEQQALGVFHAYDGFPTTAREVVTTLKALYSDEPQPSDQVPIDVSTLLERSVRTTNERAKATGWKPSAGSFRDNAAVSYADFLSSS